MKRLLNVGGGSKDFPIPSHYSGWEHVLLDIDPTRDADVICDARNLVDLPENEYDAIYCAHNLEHYFRHDLPAVLNGFTHVLRADGFAEVRVPDVIAVFAEVQRRGMSLDDVLDQTPSGPITPNDVVYGYGREIAESGNDFYAHKNAFTPKSLSDALITAGFARIFTWFGEDIVIGDRSYKYEIRAIAFKQEPTREQRELLRLPSGS